MKNLQIFLFIVLAFVLILGCSSSKTVKKTDDVEVQRDYKTEKYWGPKKKLAIAKFENATRFGKRRLGENVTTVLTTELSRTNRFILLERAQTTSLITHKKISLKMGSVMT